MGGAGAHVLPMTTTAKRPGSTRRSGMAERPVVYRGIKLAPMFGKRSAISRAIREDLQAVSDQTRGEPAKA